MCVIHNAPNFAREMKSFREHVSEPSLNAFKHRHEAATAHPPEALAASAQRYLEGRGYKVRRLPREDGVLLAAKATQPRQGRNKHQGSRPQSIPFL